MHLVLVAGAGASRELGESGPLPLMADWSNALCEALDSKERHLAAAVHLTSGMSGPEFEEALGLLLRWEQMRYLEQRFEGLGGPSPNSTTGEIPQARERTNRRMTIITRTVNESLYDQFGMGRVSDEAAREAYRRLFKVLEGRNKLDGLVVATTNYDRAAEAALRGLGFRPETGFAPESERSRWLDPSGLVEKCADDPKVVPVLHLHGAVGWYEQHGQVYDRSGDQPFNPTLGAPVVLYPDPDKDPTSGAAVDMLWREFRYALDHATHVLVIGHSLNDPALVRVLGELPADTSVGVTVLEGDDDSWVREKVPRALLVPARLGPELSISGAAVAAFSKPIG